MCVCVHARVRVHVCCAVSFSGGAEADDLSSSGGEQQPDAAEAHHAGCAAPSDPTQPNQPSPGHRARSSSGVREHGLCCAAGPVCHSGVCV